jgi:hypothetical protein
LLKYPCRHGCENQRPTNIPCETMFVTFLILETSLASASFSVNNLCSVLLLLPSSHPEISRASEHRISLCSGSLCYHNANPVFLTPRSIAPGNMMSTTLSCTTSWLPVTTAFSAPAACSSIIWGAHALWLALNDPGYSLSVDPNLTCLLLPAITW